MNPRTILGALTITLSAAAIPYWRLSQDIYSTSSVILREQEKFQEEAWKTIKTIQGRHEEEGEFILHELQRYQKHVEEGMNQLQQNHSMFVGDWKGTLKEVSDFYQNFVSNTIPEVQKTNTELSNRIITLDEKIEKLNRQNYLLQKQIDYLASLVNEGDD